MPTFPSDILRRAEALSRAGDTEGAEEALRGLLGNHPDNSEALNALAVTLMGREAFAEAIVLLERAIGLNPKAPILHCNLAEARRRAGDPEKAIVHAQAAMALRPDHPQAKIVLGLALINFGIAQQRLRRFAEAETAYRRAVALDSGNAEAHNNLAGMLLLRGRMAEAEEASRKSAALAPADISKQINLARVLLTTRKFVEGSALIARVVQQAPANADALIVQAAYDREERDLEGAREAITAALDIDPTRPEALTLLGQILFDAGGLSEGIDAHQRAVALAPESWDAQYALGMAFRDIGRFDEARASFLRCRALWPENHMPLVSLTEVKKFRRGDDDDLIAMQRAASAPMADEERAYLHFALAKSYDDFGQFREAGEHMLRANALKRASIDYDEAQTLLFFDRVKQAFSADVIDRLRGAGAPSRLPIFVFGMPRSGTTLVEQIIASHPAVAGAGELPLLDDVAGAMRGAGGARYPECVPSMSGVALTDVGGDILRRLSLHAPGVERITDKAPSTYFHVGLVHLALPGARMIHATRDSIDTCLSCFSKLFGAGHEYSYDLRELGRYFRTYRDLMEHWRAVLQPGAFLDVRYEDVVSNAEGQARRILEFCGLEWDPRVLDFHQTTGAVRTWSAQQVRQPIYGSAVGRWRNYEDMLRPLLEELGDLADP